MLQQKDLLLQEMQHRIANSLQIIASILLLKARTVQSEETRQHLQDAHKRVMSVASVQQHLRASGQGEQIEVAPYLSKLCETLAQSMIGDSRPITVEVVGNGDTVSSSDAVSIGLIVTEGVLNALKHAFGPKIRKMAGLSLPIRSTAPTGSFRLQTTVRAFGVKALLWRRPAWAPASSMPWRNS